MELLLLCLLIYSLTKSSYSDDYFKYTAKIRPCALLESHSRSTGKLILEETLPTGYTFFVSSPISNDTTFVTKTIKKECILKFCHDGPFETDCNELKAGNVLEHNPDTNASLICTCKTKVSEILQEQRFNRTFTGVVFSPYVKNWSVDKDGVRTISKWNNYTMDEVKSLILILATKFNHISTYGTGATAISRSWEEGDSTGFVPAAAAEVNKILKTHGMSTITVTQGIYQNEYNDIQNQEIQNALSAAAYANQIFPGTVTGIIFTSDYITNEVTGKAVCDIIDKNKRRAKELGLKVGIRLRSCLDIIPAKLSEADNNLHSVPSNYTYESLQLTGPEQIFRNLMDRVNFIICSHTPPAFIVQKGMATVIDEYGNTFLQIEKILKAVNKGVVVMAQAGWASWGVSSNGATNNIENLIEFWNRMNSWASVHQFHLDMFEAFDEPWKNDVNDLTNSGPSGPFGAEGNYGWWKRHDSKSGKFYTYIPKIQELESHLPGIIIDDSHLSRNNNGLDSIIGALVILVILILGITAFLIWRLRKARQNIMSKKSREIANEFRNGSVTPAQVDENVKEDNENLNSFDDTAPEKSFIFALRYPYNKKYELSRKKFTVDENYILGQGHYGIVYKGKIEGVEGDVAFKTLKSNGSIIELKNLLSEIKIMSYVGQHDHIVNLLGAYTAKIEQGEIYVASEYCEQGNLEKYLKAQRGHFQDNQPLGQNPSSPISNSTPTLNYVMAFIEDDPTPTPFIIPQRTITTTDLFKWAYQIAFGMEHIAKKKVIHSDLATRNVLLTVNGTAKIADFGLSRQLYYKSEYMKSNTKEELPWRWMSLESLRSLIFSVESDVWSFGITLWEIFSLGELPYPGVPGWTTFFLNELENNNYRMGPPSRASDEVFDLMLKCWQKEPTQRPSFSDLKESLYEKWERAQSSNT